MVQGHSVWSAGQEGEAPEAEGFLAFGRPSESAKFAPLTVSGKLCICDVTSLLN